jgi:hypothetical protein
MQTRNGKRVAPKHPHAGRDFGTGLMMHFETESRR